MPVQSLLDLAGEHRRAVVGQQGPWQASLHQGLAKPVDEDLGGLLQIPLKVTAEPGVVVEEAGSASSIRPKRSAPGVYRDGNRRATVRGCARLRSSEPRAPRPAAPLSCHLRRRLRASPRARIARVSVA